MANVQNLGVASFDIPIDQIRIVADREHAGLLFARETACMRKLPDEVNRLAQGPRHAGGAFRISPIEIAKDFVEVSTRTRREMDRHQA